MGITDLIGSFRKHFERLASAGLLSFQLAVEPVPASRPRVTRWKGVYYGAPYERFRKAAQPLCDAFNGMPTDQPLIVFLEHVVEKPRTGKLLWPRGDIDNFDKGPLDAMTKAQKFWNDDNQIVGLISFKRYAEPGEEPGIYASWFPAN